MFLMISNEDQRNELETFYQEIQNCLLNIAYLSLHNDNDAEDAVQEAFREIIRNPDSFFNVDPENRAAYMIAVVRNISVDMFNKKNKVRLEVLDEEGFYDDNQLLFEDGIIGKVSKDKLKQFIKTLPPLQRDVLTLRCLMGFSVAETATKLNISQSAVKKRLHLAKAAVSKYIQKENGIYE